MAVLHTSMQSNKKRLAWLACRCYFFTSCANFRRFHAYFRRIHVNFRRTILRVFMHYFEATRGLVFIFTFSASLLPWVQDVLVQGKKSTKECFYFLKVDGKISMIEGKHVPGNNSS